MDNGQTYRALMRRSALQWREFKRLALHNSAQAKQALARAIGLRNRAKAAGSN